MSVQRGQYFLLVVAVVCAGCKHSFTRQDALTAIQHHETLSPLLAPSNERVAHETGFDCRAIYSTDSLTAQAAGDSAWILLSGTGWMDLADVDTPSDPRQKKHCRAVLTAKADKAAFHEPDAPSPSPWTSYWVVETAHTRAEVFDIPGDAVESNSAVADFELVQERTPIGEMLHQPKWSEASARLFSTTLTGHFRHDDDGWRLESFEEKK